MKVCKCYWYTAVSFPLRSLFKSVIVIPKVEFCSHVLLKKSKQLLAYILCAITILQGLFIVERIFNLWWIAIKDYLKWNLGSGNTSTSCLAKTAYKSNSIYTTLGLTKNRKKIIKLGKATWFTQFFRQWNEVIHFLSFCLHTASSNCQTQKYLVVVWYPACYYIWN